MNERSDIDRVLRHWFADGASTMPDRVVDVVADRIARQPQRHVWRPPWRVLPMNPTFRIGTAIAAVLVLAVLGWNLLPGRPGGAGGPAATPTSTSTPSFAASPSLSPVASPTTGWPSGSLAAGRHEVELKGVRFSFDVPEGWRTTAFEGVIQAGAYPTSGYPWIAFLDEFDRVASEACSEATTAVGPTVEDLANALTTIPGTEAVDPVDTTVGGLPAKLVELTINDDIPCAPDQFWIYGFESAWPNSTNSTIRVWVFELDGTRYSIHSDQVGINSDIAAEIFAIVDSIEFD
jgi:hypothetical protein